MPAFEIIDRQTGAIVGRASTINGARRSVDRRDLAYGACRFGFRNANDGKGHI